MEIVFRVSGWPRPYLECIRRYNAGEHWHAHEVLEDLWRATAEPERRRFYQGIIQLAAAFVHAERGNLRGVQRLLAKAEAKLQAVSSPYLGLDVTACCAPWLPPGARRGPPRRPRGGRSTGAASRAWC